MKILISGSSGFVGRAVCKSLHGDGHAITRLVRPGSASQSGFATRDIPWDPPTGSIDLAASEGMDAVVHLAGASIAGGRWTFARKQLLRSSRIDATRHLVDSLAKLKEKPRALISASAVGYYGDRGDETLTESSAAGNDFLAQLAREWEAETAQAEHVGIRPVMLRFGIVLAAQGGALGRILPPFRLGLGGRLGSGRQWMSWLTLEEAVGFIRHAIENNSLRGPVNAVSPHPVTNAEFTRILSGVLHRPALLPAPGFLLRLLLGEMADALLLSSQRVEPHQLQALGYAFRFTELERALESVLH